MKEYDIFDGVLNEKLLSEEETAARWEELGAPDMLVIAEKREHPVYRQNRLPERLFRKANLRKLSDEARPQEVYAFQLVIYAGVKLMNLRVEGAACVNLSGIDAQGRPFVNRLNVEKNRAQTLWLYVQAEGAGVCKKLVTVSADGVAPVTVEIDLNVKGEPISEGGDLEPWRLSTLRWLNSTRGIDDLPTAAYPPIAMLEDKILVPGRAILLGAGGLPEAIKSAFTGSNESISNEYKDVLGEGIAFAVKTSAGTASLDGAKWRVQDMTPGRVRVVSTAEFAAFALHVQADIEFDGYMTYDVELTAKEEFEYDDASLRIAYKNAKYWMGLGKQGGYRKGTLRFCFDEKRNQDTLWMGDINAGLMVRLKDENYKKPFMLIYYHDSPLNVPDSWDNDGKGEVMVDENGVFTARSGARRLKKGEAQHFIFDLCVTPVKALAYRDHFTRHTYHAVDAEPTEVKKDGAGYMNVHHGNRYNPFINTPCFETEALRALAKKCHDAGMMMRIYLTIKELSLHAPEFFAFYSLNGEILPKPTKEFPTWQGDIPYADEMIARLFDQGDIITAWRQRVNDGPYDNAIEASALVAPMSRLNNHYIERIHWLLKHADIDGLYFDDTAYDRSVMKRVRKTLDRHHDGCTIDLHSWNYYADNTVDDASLAGHGNSMNLYIDQAAFIDGIWFGEGFDYAAAPDVWLVEMSGLPFGLMGDMLQGGGDPYAGMLFGMTSRMPNESDPRPLFRLFRAFGIEDSVMRGFWNDDAPIAADKEEVFVTTYKKDGEALVAVVNRSKEEKTFALRADKALLGFDAENAKWYCPEVQGFQKESSIDAAAVRLEAGKGRILWVKKEESSHA